jgi:hypothetical protein
MSDAGAFMSPPLDLPSLETWPAAGVPLPNKLLAGFVVRLRRDDIGAGYACMHAKILGRESYSSYQVLVLVRDMFVLDPQDEPEVSRSNMIALSTAARTRC